MILVPRYRSRCLFPLTSDTSAGVHSFVDCTYSASDSQNLRNSYLLVVSPPSDVTSLFITLLKLIKIKHSGTFIVDDTYNEFESQEQKKFNQL
jgi:hypothetical protein